MISNPRRADAALQRRASSVETAAKAGDRVHDRDAIGALDKILHERAADLNLVERKTAEIASTICWLKP
jgi:hypothetical protein